MEWNGVSVTLALLVGLSMTRLLSGLVAVFRARQRVEMDWVSITWAAVLILVLLEVWTALNGLATITPRFSFGEYLALGGFMMLLYAAAALILPPGEIGAGESLRTYFRDEGRYALPMLSLFLAAGAAVNATLFGQSLASLWFALDVPMIALPTVAFLARGRRTLALATGVYIPLVVADTVVSILG
jgi:hypothetical protein